MAENYQQAAAATLTGIARQLDDLARVFLDHAPDHPTTTTYGMLIYEHAQLARKGDEPARRRMFAIEVLRELSPDKCQIWDDRYTRAPSPSNGSE